MANSIGLVNTGTFTEAANHFRRYGRYDDGVPDTIQHRQYWNEELRRCKEGYSSGGVYISGYYYHYLNYSRIIKTTETFKEIHSDKVKFAKRVGKREEDFPSFWDVDFAYFTAVDIAENGISLESYKQLPITLNIHEASLAGGHHLLWLKPRGVGASWKAASMATRNYACLRGTFTYMLANDKTFLEGDGLFSKFLILRDWQIAENIVTGGINAPGIGKLAEKKNDLGGMQVRSGVIEEGKEIGFKSEVQGVALAGDEQKARGKRGKLILWEEFGKFPKVDLAWEIARPSVEELDIVYGLMLGFGTGGTKDANFEGLKKMFYNPLLYNLLFFDNVYSENVKEGDICAMFTPAYKSIAYIDKNGNSDEIKAKEVIDEVRLQAEQNTIDPTLAPRKKAENPYTPEEAVLVTGKNIFISKGLEDHTKKVEILETYRTFPTMGKFEKVGFELKFVIDNTLTPVWTFPHKPSDDIEGAVLMYQAPYRKNGKIPDNLYKICVDTYRHADTTGDSIGSIYVIEQANNFTPTKGDFISACFNGRPKGADGQEKFNQTLFELAEYYNAEIAFENDEPGDVIGYAKRKRKTHMLAEEFELAYDENLKSSNGTSRGFGMKMASGKEDKRKKQGDLYIKYWLYTERYTTFDGETIYNYHTIKDLGLLKEFINYNSEGGNFDRISAFRVGMYHQQEMMYNEQVPRDVTNKDSVSRFFEKALF